MAEHWRRYSPPSKSPSDPTPHLEEEVLSQHRVDYRTLLHAVQGVVVGHIGGVVQRDTLDNSGKELQDVNGAIMADEYLTECLNKPRPLRRPSKGVITYNMHTPSKSILLTFLRWTFVTVRCGIWKSTTVQQNSTQTPTSGRQVTSVANFMQISEPHPSNTSPMVML